MLAWMLYVVMVTLLLSVGAHVAERAARLRRNRTRWIWITAIVASLALPTIVSSVSVELPTIVAPAVARKMVVLRDATTQVLSPVMWISGSPAEPRGWSEFDSLLTTLWRAASAAMLLALVASGIVLFARKRRWKLAQVSGAQVYVTEGVGPAVVGLLRPRIVVPSWVTLALPRLQSAVIAHEQSHLKAGDPQLFTLALALLVFMPWNLPLWWQLRRLRHAIEVDCDARVLEGGIDPTHYGETLISVGERQSAYIGAVAAMSESKSFLEERIRIMISKPVRWSRAGVPVLVCVALSVTALAAQVSPPNMHTVDATGKPGGESHTPGERVAIKLPAATLDRYVGQYKLGEGRILTVTRKGDGLEAQLTSQPAVGIYAETEKNFFYKVVNAQIDFVSDGGPATAAVLHQGGANITMPRIDDGTAAQIKAEIAARVAANVPAPGSEAAMRKVATSLQSGSPDYEDMESPIADITRSQVEHGLLDIMGKLGAVQSVEFQRVGDGGWDVYRVRYANGAVLWRITMSPGGKISYLAALPDA